MRRRFWSWHYEIECFSWHLVFWLSVVCHHSVLDLSWPHSWVRTQHNILEKMRPSSQTDPDSSLDCAISLFHGLGKIIQILWASVSLFLSCRWHLLKLFWEINWNNIEEDLAKHPTHNKCSRNLSCLSQPLSGCCPLCSGFWKVETMFLRNSLSRS